MQLTPLRITYIVSQPPGGCESLGAVPFARIRPLLGLPVSARARQTCCALNREHRIGDKDQATHSLTSATPKSEPIRAGGLRAA